MYDEDIKIDADATALAQLIIQIVNNANESETATKIGELQTKIDSLENQIEEFDIHDHSYDVGEIAVEHINSYGGFTEMVTEVLDEYDFSDKEMGVASGTTFTVTVDWWTYWETTYEDRWILHERCGIRSQGRRTRGRLVILAAG